MKRRRREYDPLVIDVVTHLVNHATRSFGDLGEDTRSELRERPKVCGARELVVNLFVETMLAESSRDNSRCTHLRE